MEAAELQKTKPFVYLAAAGHVSRPAVAPSVAAHGDDEEPSCTVRNAMTAEDVAFNVRRLRREGKTKLR